MKIKYFAVVFFILAGSLQAGSFEDYLNSRQSEFSSFNEENRSDFENYKKELKEAFSEYKRKAAEVWGSNNSEIPGVKKYVAYQDDFKKKTVIDFEKGKVKVELIVSENENKIEERLKTEVKKSLQLKGDKRSIIEIARKPFDIKSDKDDKPVLDGLLNVRGNDYEALGSKIISQKKYKTKKVKGEDNKERISVSVEFDLSSDHMEKRAKKYIDTVLSESEKRGVDPELIYAIIETESSFNPYAKSPIPAFGLMQLVPTTAGRDSYKLVHREDKAPTDKFLYEAENNIELGAAYFYILFNRYLDEVKDPESRKWCVIAAYNTGIGNIFKTFQGKYSSKKYNSRQEWKLKAFDKINGMKPDEVYDYLCKNLPYEETRNYVIKVKNRIPGYKISKNSTDPENKLVVVNPR